MNKRMGTIKKIVSEKGFGFIQTGGQKDVFFHHSEVKDIDFKTLSEGDEVEFEVETTDKGLKAVQVRLCL